MINVLVLGGPTWDNSNSFGNTFSNLFGGMPEVEIYYITPMNGSNNNNVVKTALQFSDKTVLHSIFHPSYDPCHIMNNEVIDRGEVVSDEVYNNLKKKRYALFFYIRNLIWLLGRWRGSKVLDSFLKDTKPDLIYVNIFGDFTVSQRYQLNIIQRMNVPVVGHITDDIYPYHKYGLSPLKYFLHYLIRRNIRKLINRCSYVECFAPQMKVEYEKVFHVPFYIIGKGVRKEMIERIKFEVPQKDELSFVYTGGIGAGRDEVLYRLGTALDSLTSIKLVKLHIYTQTILTDKMRRKYETCKSIVFHGKVSGDVAIQRQQEADFLIHVESFSKASISATRLSFSTKIIDYLLTGHPIVAIGPAEIYSIQELSNMKIAVTITALDDMVNRMRSLLNNHIDIDSIQKNVKHYLQNNRDIEKIQAGMLNRMKEIVR